jgi:hypothetical protein
MKTLAQPKQAAGGKHEMNASLRRDIRGIFESFQNFGADRIGNQTTSCREADSPFRRRGEQTLDQQSRP